MKFFEGFLGEAFFQESSPKRVPYKSKFEGWLNSYIEKFDKYLENMRNIRYNNIWLNHIWKGVTVLADKLNDSFTTLAGDARVEFEEKKSLFIGHAMRTDSEEEALAFIKRIKKEYNDSTNNVFAYTMNKGILARYSDDGEPQGTSGMPTLDTIRKSGVDNACVVITRYFGGTLLGAGGLVRAYSHTAALALEAAGIVTYEPYSEFEIRCGYSEYQKYSAYFGEIGAVIDDTVFEADVTVRFAVKRRRGDEVLNKITEMSYGKDVAVLLGERYDYR